MKGHRFRIHQVGFVIADQVLFSPGPPTVDCGCVVEVVEWCRPRRQFSGSQATTVPASWPDAPPQFETPVTSVAHTERDRP